MMVLLFRRSFTDGCMTLSLLWTARLMSLNAQTPTKTTRSSRLCAGSIGMVCVFLVLWEACVVAVEKDVREKDGYL